MVHTRQYTVPLQRPAADTDIWLSPEYPGGYGWLFPKGRLANLGVGADKRLAADLKGPLDRLHRRLEREAELAGLLDVAYTIIDSPLGALLLAATERGLVRVAFASEGHDRVLETLGQKLSPRILRAPARLRGG